MAHLGRRGFGYGISPADRPQADLHDADGLTSRFRLSNCKIGKNIRRRDAVGSGDRRWVDAPHGDFFWDRGIVLESHYYLGARGRIVSIRPSAGVAEGGELPPSGYLLYQLRRYPGPRRRDGRQAPLQWRSSWGSPPIRPGSLTSTTWWCSLVTIRVVKGEQDLYGTCKETDKDGDYTCTTFDGKAHYFIGTRQIPGDYRRGAVHDRALAGAQEDLGAMIIPHEVTWKIEVKWPSGAAGRGCCRIGGLAAFLGRARPSMFTAR